MKDPLIGVQLANFRIERLLGQGGMATVYYGQDVKLHRPVAVKVLDKRYKGHAAYASRFVNEARMMAKWRHENIIQIYYADEADGLQYYVMEHVDGQDLATLMESLHERGNLMPVHEALQIGDAVASALDYAHRQGVIHRDVKPSNILLSKDGRILLGDFGLALEVRDGSLGSVFGSPHYISPEQAKRSADAVPQSDLYSLGVILYEILTGTVPFNDPSPASVALQHITEPPPSPRSINPQLPPAAEQVLLKALAKHPKDRYRSGLQLMEALEAALSNDPAGGLSLPPLPVGVPTVRRDIPEQYATPPAHMPPVEKLPPTVRVEEPPKRRKGLWLFLLFLLIAVGAGYFLFKNRGMMALPSATATRTSAPPQATLTQTSAPPPTATEKPAQPTQTSAQVEATSIPSSTPPPSPTSTATKTSIPPTASSSPTYAVPTVLYPQGYPFALIYNESSFYLLNRSIVRRSLSGFSFQRLDVNGNLLEDAFQGYIWEKPNNKNLLPKYCTSIIVYGLNIPYLNPPDCEFGIVGVVQPRFDRPQGQIFWTRTEDSDQFRVLWLGEEVARCNSDDGWCDFFIP